MHYQTEVPSLWDWDSVVGDGRLVGLGLGRLLRCTLHLHLELQEELLLQPLLPRNQHPSPTTAFTNIKQPRVLLLARDVQPVHASPRQAVETFVIVVGSPGTVLTHTQLNLSFRGCLTAIE